jgi:hypothetical protein
MAGFPTGRVEVITPRGSCRGTRSPECPVAGSAFPASRRRA